MDDDTLDNCSERFTFFVSFSLENKFIFFFHFHDITLNNLLYISKIQRYFVVKLFLLVNIYINNYNIIILRN